MGISRLTYIISEGFNNVMKNKKSSFASLLSMICAMFLFGACFMLGENINEILRQVQENQGIEAFITNEANDIEVEELKTEILKIEGVNKVDYISKQQALDTVKETYKDVPAVYAGYDNDSNIFPASYIVTLTDLSFADDVQTKLENMKLITDVRSSDQTIETLMRIANWIRIAIFAAFAGILFLAVTIIVNTIKLTVHARRKEISIMKYVGATNSFIRWPFMIEGIIIGVVSASITMGFLALGYSGMVTRIETNEVFGRLGISLLQFTDMTQILIIVFLALGIGIGMLGSRISMRKYLEV